MQRWKTLPPNVLLTLTDCALRTIELPVLPAIVGRRGADVVIEHPSGDPEHAKIELSGGCLAVRDLRSRNGTFVNGRPISTDNVPLNDGDRLTLGAVTLAVGLRSISQKKAGVQVIDPNARTVVASTDLADATPQPPTPLRPMLLVVVHHGRQRQFLLERPVQVVGRMADIRVSDPALSRKHVQIELSADHALLKDLASANGTFVAGKPFSVYRVGDEVTFHAGETTFHLTQAQR